MRVKMPVFKTLQAAFTILAVFALVVAFPTSAAPPQQDGNASDRSDGPIIAQPPPAGSPYAPPEETDTLFAIDSAPTLDQYLFRDDGPIVFDIDIDRYVGSIDSNGFLEDPTSLVQNGIVSTNAILQIAVWDVDEGFPGDPDRPEVEAEVDIVTVNAKDGCRLDSKPLTGANNTWSVWSVKVPIECLKFPVTGTLDTPPIPVHNEIRIDIDTANADIGVENWAVQVDWGAISFQAARPVAFIHGNNGRGTAWIKQDPSKDELYGWHNFKGNFDVIGLPGETVDNDGSDLPGGTPLMDNARALESYVNEIKTKYGVDKINVVAHSKGGLESRGYISRVWPRGQEADIETLVTLATPHRGMKVAFLGWAIGNPAWKYVNSAAVGWFNLWTPNRNDVSYYTVAGSGGWYWQSIPNPCDDKVGPDAMEYTMGDLRILVPWSLIKAVYRYEGNDGYMSESEAQFPLSWPGTHLGTRAKNHHTIRDDADIAELIRPVLVLPTASTSSMLSAVSCQDPVEVASEPEDPGFTAYASGGTVAAGATETIMIEVDTAGDTIFHLWSITNTLQLDLVTPDAKEITPSVAASDPNVDYGEGMDFESATFNWTYYLTDTVAGSWQMEVVNTLDQAVDYGALVVMSGEIRLAASVDVYWHALGDMVHVYANLTESGNPIPAATVNATVTQPDSSTVYLSLRDDGAGGDTTADDGVYAGSFIADQVGEYEIAVEARGTSPEGKAFNRSAGSAFQVAPDKASLSDSYSDTANDTDGNGLYDSLDVRVGLDVLVAGTYEVMAKLFDPSDNEITWTNTHVTLSPGNRNVSLSFSGEDIYAHGANGYYTVKDVFVLDWESGAQLDYDDVAYTTGQMYDAAQFEHAPIALTGSSSDRGTDADGNGLYDLLTVRVGVEVTQSGSYYWTARLMASDDYEYGWYSGSGYLGTGYNEITLVFEGEKIGHHRLDGPYHVRDLSLHGPPGSSMSVIEAATTTAYDYMSFEGSRYKIFLPLLLLET